MRFCKCVSDLQTYDKARNAVALALSPVVRALVDPDGAMRNIRELDNVCVLCHNLFPFCFFLIKCMSKSHIRSEEHKSATILLRENNSSKRCIK